MSYKSRHQLIVIEGNLNAEDISRELEAEYGKPDHPAEWYDILNRYPINWEGYEEQMLEISAKLPEAVLALDIMGEDDFEITREYYQNGRAYQVTRPPMPKFDPWQLR